jgi:hypothetical protein
MVLHNAILLLISLSVRVSHMYMCSDIFAEKNRDFSETNFSWQLQELSFVPIRGMKLLIVIDMKVTL